MEVIIFIILILLFLNTSVYENINWDSVVRNTNDKNIVYDQDIKEIRYYDTKMNLSNIYKNLDDVNNKYISKLIMKKNGIQTPTMYIWNNELTTEKNLDNVKKTLSKNLVVKPSHGKQGNNVFTNIDYTELLPIINTITADLDNKINERILIENQVFGSLYRIIVVNDEIIGVVKRIKPKVIGNGINTLNELIIGYNHLQVKNKDYKSVVDYNYISKQGFYLENIIDIGKIIYLTNVINYHNGAMTQNTNLKNIHPDNILLFKKINKIFDINISGIDYISKDISISHKNDGNIIEVNGQPGVASNLKVDKLFAKKLINNLVQKKTNYLDRSVSYIRSFFK